MTYFPHIINILLKALLLNSAETQAFYFLITKKFLHSKSAPLWDITLSVFTELIITERKKQVLI